MCVISSLPVENCKMPKNDSRLCRHLRHWHVARSNLRKVETEITVRKYGLKRKSVAGKIEGEFKTSELAWKKHLPHQTWGTTRSTCDCQPPAVFRLETVLHSPLLLRRPFVVRLLLLLLLHVFSGLLVYTTRDAGPICGVFNQSRTGNRSLWRHKI